MNYFELLELPQSFDVDLNELEKKYFELQRKFHPDREGADMQMATTVNDAYKVLKDPLKRSEYLLSLDGVIVNDESGAVKPDKELLMEAMEQRETLSEAEGKAEIESLKKEAQENRKKYIDELGIMFMNGDIDGAAKLTIRLKYLEKFLQEIKIK